MACRGRRGQIGAPGCRGWDRGFRRWHGSHGYRAHRCECGAHEGIRGENSPHLEIPDGAGESRIAAANRAFPSSPIPLHRHCLPIRSQRSQHVLQASHSNHHPIVNERPGSGRQMNSGITGRNGQQAILTAHLDPSVLVGGRVHRQVQKRDRRAHGLRSQRSGRRKTRTVILTTAREGQQERQREYQPDLLHVKPLPLSSEQGPQKPVLAP
jgi:hypothetical protein